MIEWNLKKAKKGFLLNVDYHCSGFRIILGNRKFEKVNVNVRAGGKSRLDVQYMKKIVNEYKIN